jgi:hypothetical protein
MLVSRSYLEKEDFQLPYKLWQKKQSVFIQTTLRFLETQKILETLSGDNFKWIMVNLQWRKLQSSVYIETKKS